jgi:serine/threonine-protein kinase
MEAALSAGDVLAERYRLVAPVGRGGSSVVWVADHVITGKRVALKVLTRRGDEVAARFLREARITSRLAHPNIVDIHDVFQLEESDELVMVMDLLEGQSLAERLRARAPRTALSLDETARIVLAITSALDAAHALGVVHRDLKPENVFLATDGTLRVLDFGVAKWSRPVSEAMLTPSLTETGAIVGTPHYMAPEQVFGEPDVDGRADVWALGVIAYECLAAQRPVEGDNFGQVFKAIAVGDIVPLRERAPSVPLGIAALVDRMLSTGRETRPSLGEVRAAFEAKATSPATVNGLAPQPRARAGSRGVVVVVVGAVAVAVAVAAASLQADRSASPLVSTRDATAVAEGPAAGPSLSVSAEAPSEGPSASVPPASAVATESAALPVGVAKVRAPSPRGSGSGGPNASAPPSTVRALPGRVHGEAPY